jgi:hypothetical protein
MTASQSLLTVFPTLADLLGALPEDLAAIILELAPLTMRDGRFDINQLLAQLYKAEGASTRMEQRRTQPCLSPEALSWLVSQGLIVLEPTSIGIWYRITRRGANLKTKADVSAFVTARILTEDLVADQLAGKVLPIFRRGDYDVAVFQAVKELEVASRKAANANGAGYPDDCVGVRLMREAFNPDRGVLTDQNLVPAEREAEMKSLRRGYRPRKESSWS